MTTVGRNNNNNNNNNNNDNDNDNNNDNSILYCINFGTVVVPCRIILKYHHV